MKALCFRSTCRRSGKPAIFVARALGLWVGVSLLFLGASGCGLKSFLNQKQLDGPLVSGDIVVVAGGNVATTTSPFPLHQLVAFSNDGKLKGVLYKEQTLTGMLMGVTLSSDLSHLLFTIDTVDRIGKIALASPKTSLAPIIDSNVTGTTLRAVETLSDGGILIAESTTSIEKLDANLTRVTTNFPITVSANIMNIRAISGGRFILVYTGGNDSPSIRNNNGTSIGTISLAGLGCGTNCDPADVLELSDGRFIVAYQAAAARGLEIYSSTFTRIGTFFRDSAVLAAPSALAQLNDGSVLACDSTYNVCERFIITGDTGQRSGSEAFISAATLIRTPTDVVVIP